MTFPIYILLGICVHEDIAKKKRKKRNQSTEEKNTNKVIEIYVNTIIILKTTKTLISQFYLESHGLV